MTRPKANKPARPWKDYPLFAHASGTWAKKIDGKHKHFGPWADPRGAFERYQEYMGSARLEARPRRTATATLSVENLIDGYITFQHERVRTKQLTLRSFKDCRSVTLAFGQTVNINRPTTDLAPADFAAHAKAIGHMGAYAFNRNVAIIRGMFKWAFNAGLIEHPPRYGDEFRTRPQSAKRREAREREMKHGKRLFTEPELRVLIDKSQPSLKAMILLAINCGMGNTDLGKLASTDVDLDAAVLDYSRPKTGISRRAVLWPETVKAIREWMKLRPRAKSAEDDRIVFITAFGVPFVRERVETIDGVMQNPSAIDSIGLLFGKLAKTLKMKGRGFYAIRATFRTWAAEAPGAKDAAIKRIMGHAIGGVDESYVRAVSDHDLRSITDYVRAKLFLASKARQKRMTPGKGSRRR